MEITLPSSVAICARAKTGQIDVSDYECVIGINNTHVQEKFEPSLIIAMDDLKRDEKVEPDYVDAIVNKGCPVLSTRKFRKWPSVQPYPLEDVCRWLKRKTGLPPHRLLDCSISFAIALCLRHLVARVGLSGIDLTPPYNALAMKRGMLQFTEGGYRKPPDWFKYYSQDALKQRRPREPGWESVHYLVGFGTALGMKFEWGKDSTLMNSDRDRYFYGYNDMPRLK